MPSRKTFRKLGIETLESRVMLSGTGLSGQYFHNDDFTGLAAERSENVNFNWGSSSPVAGVDPNTFSVRWTGQVEADYSENYTFYTTSNQGVRLWVDGNLLIDNWEPHNTEEDSASITLVSGQKYDLRLEYYEQFGTAEIQLEWSSASRPRQVIPSTHLYESPAGLYGLYSDNFGGSAERVDTVFDFDWGIGRPHPSVAVDQFNIRWTGQVRADFSEEYTFSIESDEGARLWIGNELVINDWTAHTTQVASGTKMLEAGKWYDVRLEFFDNTGHAEVDLKWSSASQTGVGTFAVVPSTNLRAAKAATQQFTNPLGPGADPFVTLWDGQYYLLSTTGNNVRMERAASLEKIHISDSESTSSVVWTPPGGTNYSEQIWAPELHRLNNKWYIYVAASDGNNATHRMHVLERDNPDPMGPYTYKGEVNTGSAGSGIGSWAIDGTVLSWQGVDYFVWSGWPDPVNPFNPEGTQNLYIAEMFNPWTLTGPQILLSSVTESWEDADGPGGRAINEGPQVLIDDGNLHIIYSANGYWMHEYLLGRLTYDGVGPLLNASSWQKSTGPVFQQAGDIVGTGHASFTTSLDGAEHWIVYHAHHDKNNFQEDRDILIQPFDFAADGTPDFGAPIPTQTPLQIPSGIADPERPFVTSDHDASGDVGVSDLDVWTEQYGMQVFPGSSADSSGNGSVDGFDFLAWQRNLASSPPPVDSTVAYWRHEEGTVGGLIQTGTDTVQDSSGNANHMQTFDPSFTSATYSSSVSPVPLRSALPNSLSLDFGPGGDDGGQNDDNYTTSKPINSQLFSELTVELAFNMNSIGGFQTLVGKDGMPTGSPVAPLQIKVRGDNFPSGIDNQLFVEWIDGDGDIHFLSSGSTTTTGTWNHVAFVLTATDAQLYIAGETGAYTLVDAISGNDFAGSSGEVLIDSSGQFTVGRGMFNNSVTDWSDALIDEVRISETALGAVDYLFAPAQLAVLSIAADSEISQDVISEPKLPTGGQIDRSELLAAAASSLVSSATYGRANRLVPSQIPSAAADRVYEWIATQHLNTLTPLNHRSPHFTTSNLVLVSRPNNSEEIVDFEQALLDLLFADEDALSKSTIT